MYKCLVGKPEQKKLFGWYRRGWERNINGWDMRVGWICLILDTQPGVIILKTVMQLRVTWKRGIP